MKRSISNTCFPLTISAVVMVMGTSLSLAQSELSPGPVWKKWQTGAEVKQRDELQQLLEEAEKERLSYSPDKKLLAHSDGRQVTVWSVEERWRLHRFVLEGRSLPAATTFSPDDR